MKKFYQFIIVSIVLSCSKDSDVVNTDLTNSNQTTQVNSFQNTSSNSEGDFDGDGVTDDKDYYPYNPYKTIDDWGQNVDQYPTVFAANDITEINRKGLEDDLKLAADYFGKYEVGGGQLEEKSDAMLELASDWCDRRIERGQLFYYDEFKMTQLNLKKYMHDLYCSSSRKPGMNGNRNTGGDFFTSDLSSFEGWMETYRKIGLNLPSGSANAGMVRNSGYTVTQSSIPFQYDPLTIPAGYDWISKEEHSIMVFHEYYHITQVKNVMATEEIVDETGNTVRP